MLYNKLVELVGAVPRGYEPLVYVIACLFLLWLLGTFFSVIWSFLRLASGDRRG